MKRVYSKFSSKMVFVDYMFRKPLTFNYNPDEEIWKNPLKLSEKTFDKLLKKLEEEEVKTSSKELR